ncbi:unnamed protein product [Ixodes pacificus]
MDAACKLGISALDICSVITWKLSCRSSLPLYSAPRFRLRCLASLVSVSEQVSLACNCFSVCVASWHSCSRESSDWVSQCRTGCTASRVSDTPVESRTWAADGTWSEFACPAGISATERELFF